MSAPSRKPPPASADEPRRTTSLVEGAAIEVDPVDGESYLLVQLTVTCDVFGRYQLQIAGPHLRPVVAMLQDFIDTFPDQTASLRMGRVSGGSDREDH